MKLFRKNTLMQIVLVLVAAVILQAKLFAQTGDQEIRASIEKLDKGQRDEVKQDLSRLTSKYQNNPGVLYLQGRMATDGIEAVKSYQSVVDNFPTSEWADDALYRIYQYYYALGLYKTAEIKMSQLKKEYPKSVYVSGKPSQKLPVNDEVAVNLPVKETAVVPENNSSETKPEEKKQEPVVNTTIEPYTLQVGAFSTSANAEKQKNYFEDVGYNVEITNKVRGGRSLYLVWVGNFSSADEARTEAKAVKAKYKIDSIVVERY